ncbi:MAG: hypothetical protein V3W14_12995, partial [Candidatus Neomarinimicrobiota bacterium]
MAWRLNSLLPWLAAAAVYGQTLADLSSDIVDQQSLSEDEQAAFAAIMDDPVDLNSAGEDDLWFLRPAVTAALLDARLSGVFTGWADLAQRTGLSAEGVAGLKAVAYLSNRAGASEISTRLASGSTGENIRSRWRYENGPWQALGATTFQPGEFQLTDHLGLSLARSGPHFQTVFGGYRFTWGLGLLMARDFPRPLGPAQL